MTSLGLHIKNGKQDVAFTCAVDCQLGAYSLRQDDRIRAISDGDGLFSIYVEWAEGALIRINAHDVNKLAGFKAVQE